MTIFNRYVKLPEGTSNETQFQRDNDDEPWDEGSQWNETRWEWFLVGSLLFIESISYLWRFSSWEAKPANMWIQAPSFGHGTYPSIFPKSSWDMTSNTPLFIIFSGKSSRLAMSKMILVRGSLYWSAGLLLILISCASTNICPRRSMLRGQSV